MPHSLSSSEMSTYLVGGARVGVEDKGDNQAVQTQDFGENENQDLDRCQLLARPGRNRVMS